MKSPAATAKGLAALVTKEPRRDGISAVLTGGTVVSIYTNNQYESRDLDFISSADRARISAAMSRIGFRPHGRSFVHEECPYTVEFPTGPLALGERQPVKAAGRLQVGSTVVQLLSPTQCVMDRLAWFFHNNDRQCLDQAVAVAESQRVSMNIIRDWAKDEGAEEKFEIFLNFLKKK